jgi:hypothetical protein
MFDRLRLAILGAFFALLLPSLAHAAGGSYVFDGGTPSEQAQVKAALDASSFDWSLVPATITIHITPAQNSEATRGNIWLDPRLLDSGRFAWGTVQHEYAHQVDYFLLDGAKRAELQSILGGDDWCYSVPGLAHVQHGCERFASTLAWSYWPVAANSMRPTSATDESGAMQPAQFRALLSELIGAPRTLALLAARQRSG